jgi:hypothetical protein
MRRDGVEGFGFPRVISVQMGDATGMVDSLSSHAVLNEL